MTPRAESSDRNASFVIAVLAFVVVVGQGLRIYLADGSYFLGEASVVLSLDGMSALQTFQHSLLGGGQNFPRLYLLAIRGVRALLGGSTWATRLLPQLFFLAGTALWLRLLYARFRARPLVMLLGVLLLAAVPTWPIYSAAVKQYTFDTFWVLALFSVPERWLDDALGEGRRRGRLVWLLLPTAFSFTYGVALLARVLGWWAHGARRRGIAIDLPAASLVGGGLVALSALLWLTDLRHTLSQQTLFEFWEHCTLPAPPRDAARILDRFLLGFYEGRVEFVAESPLPLAAHVALLLLFLLGVARVVGSTVRTHDPARAAAPPGWGSRSVGCVVGIAGAIATSFVLGYPLCPGRLLLYVLWPQQTVLLEGVDAAIAGAERIDRRRGTGRLAATAATLAALVLAGVLGRAAVNTAHELVLRTPIEDVRPQLAKLQTAPDLPVIVTGCMERQIRALPEGLGMKHVIMQSLDKWVPLPLGQEVWVIHSRQFPGPCHAIQDQFIKMTEDAPRGPPTPGHTVLVYRTRLLTLDEMVEREKERREEAARRMRARERARVDASEAARPRHR